MTILELEKNSPLFGFYDVKGQLRKFIYDRVDEALTAGDSSRDMIVDVQGLEARISYMREKFKESLGGLPSSDTPLHSRVIETIHCDGFRIEKVIFESRPKVYITANLYIPDGVVSPCGAVLFVCGHHEQAKHAEEYQTVSQYLVNAGLVVLVQDPVGQGERFSYYEDSIKGTTVEWGCPEHDYAGSQCWPLGDNIARYFVHDSMRSIDYLCTRPEVDPNKIGITGNSGGGTQTSLVMVCDPRIASAAPATFIMNEQTYMYTGITQDAEQIWPGMAACGFDHEDILLCMAPRPVLVLAVTSDFFPIEGTRRSVARVKRFWDMYGMEKNIGLFEDDSDHHYTRRMAEAAAGFFSLHLLGRKTITDERKIKTLAPSDLWCTKTGQVRSQFDDARFIFEENYSRLEQVRKERNSIPDTKRRDKALKWLKEKVFSFRKSCDFNPRFHYKNRVNELIVESCLWWSQEGLFNHGLIFKNHQYTGSNASIVIAVWDGGTHRLHQHFNWIREKCNIGNAVMVLDVSGVGALTPYPVNNMPLLGFEGTICRFTHDLMWIGDSLAALRTFDVLRAVEMVVSCMGVEKEKVSLYAYGRHGLYAQLAAAIDKRICKIEVFSGMGSYEKWIGEHYYDEYNIMSIILPEVLKYFDLPDIHRWMSEKEERD